MNLMKNLSLFTLAVIVLASCAAPKYTYHFDQYDYNSGRKAAIVNQQTPLSAPEAGTLTADVTTAPANFNQPETSEAERMAEVKSDLKRKYSEMSKAEKKEFQNDVKTEFKKYVKAMKSGDTVQSSEETAVMDNDLKLAIIFGAVGLTLTLFGGINEAFWILGVISIVVGVVFLIKWLVRQ
jgi:hypothetical protein